MDVGKYCVMHLLLCDVFSQCPLLICIFNKHATNGTSTGLFHDIIDPPPEALVLLMVDYGQYLLLLLLILTLPCVFEAVVMKVLLPLLLTVFAKVVALFQANLKALENFLDQERETIGDTTAPGGPF
jgi:hypothetical protein